MGRKSRQGRGFPAGNYYGVGGGGEGRKAYVVATETLGVREYGGGREAYGVVKNPVGDRQGVLGGIEWTHFPGGKKPLEWPPR